MLFPIHCRGGWAGLFLWHFPLVRRENEKRIVKHYECNSFRGLWVSVILCMGIRWLIHCGFTPFGKNGVWETCKYNSVGFISVSSLPFRLYLCCFSFALRFWYCSRLLTGCAIPSCHGVCVDITAALPSPSPKREHEVQTSLSPAYTEVLGMQNVRKQTDVPLGCWLQFLLPPDPVSYLLLTNKLCLWIIPYSHKFWTNNKKLHSLPRRTYQLNDKLWKSSFFR